MDRKNNTIMLNVNFELMSTTRERSVADEVTNNVGLWLHVHIHSAVFQVMRGEYGRVDMYVRSGCLDKSWLGCDLREGEVE